METSEDRRPSTPAQKILLVVDRPETVNQIRPALERDAYRAMVSREGEEAARAVTAEMPDHVVLDTTVPDLDAGAFLKRLRRNPETARLPVLVLNEQGENVDKVIGLDLAAEDFLTKPYHPAEL